MSVKTVVNVSLIKKYIYILYRYNWYFILFVFILKAQFFWKNFLTEGGHKGYIGGIIILERLWWGMAQKRLGNTALDPSRNYALLPSHRRQDLMHLYDKLITVILWRLTLCTSIHALPENKMKSFKCGKNRINVRDLHGPGTGLSFKKNIVDGPGRASNFRPVQVTNKC